MGVGRSGRGMGGGTADETGMTTAGNDGEVDGVAVCDHGSDRLDIGGYGKGKRGEIGVEAALLAQIRQHGRGIDNQPLRPEDRGECIQSMVGVHSRIIACPRQLRLAPLAPGPRACIIRGE